MDIETTRFGRGMRMFMSAVAILLGVLVLAGLLIQAGQEVLSVEFYVLYGFLGCFSILLGFISFISDFAVKHLRPDSLMARSFFIFERSKYRPGSLWIGIPVVMTIVLSMAVLIIVGSKAGNFAVPNPYTESMEYDQATFSQFSPLSNIFNGAVVPGILEEMTIFFAIQAQVFAMLFIIFLVTRNEYIIQNPVLFWLLTIVTVAFWSGVFSWAHGRYGANEQAYAFAFVFEFIVQFCNQLTGSFISWVPHIIHNAMVIFNQGFSFVLFAAVPYLPYKLNWRRSLCIKQSNSC